MGYDGTTSTYLGIVVDPQMFESWYDPFIATHIDQIREMYENAKRYRFLPKPTTTIEEYVRNEDEQQRSFVSYLMSLIEPVSQVDDLAPIRITRTGKFESIKSQYIIGIRLSSDDILVVCDQVATQLDLSVVVQYHNAYVDTFHTICQLLRIPFKTPQVIVRVEGDPSCY